MHAHEEGSEHRVELQKAHQSSAINHLWVELVCLRDFVMALQVHSDPTGKAAALLVSTHAALQNVVFGHDLVRCSLSTPPASEVHASNGRGHECLP